MSGCLYEWFIMPVGVIIYFFFILPFRALNEELTKNIAAIGLSVAVIVVVVTTAISGFTEHSLLVGGLSAWAGFSCLCGISLYICRKEIEKREEMEKQAKEDEYIKQKMREIGIDPDEPVKFDVFLYSPNNKVVKADYANNEMDDIEVEIKNDRLGTYQTIMAGDIHQVKELAEEVFRFWARREEEPDYLCTLQNYAKRPPKSYKTVQIVGIKYRGDEAYQRYKELMEGEKLLLVMEPDNPYDENAIKVLTQDGIHIGYLAKDYAKKLQSYLDSVSYGWYYHYDERQDFFNSVHIYRHYMSYEAERDTFNYQG